MKTLTIREMRASLGRLDEILDQEGELLVTRRGRPVARVMPLESKGRLPSHRALRASLPPQPSSTDAIRADRAARD